MDLFGVDILRGGEYYWFHEEVDEGHDRGGEGGGSRVPGSAEGCEVPPPGDREHPGQVRGWVSLRHLSGSGLRQDAAEALRSDQPRGPGVHLGAVGRARLGAEGGIDEEALTQ